MSNYIEIQPEVYAYHSALTSEAAILITFGYVQPVLKIPIEAK